MAMHKAKILVLGPCEAFRNTWGKRTNIENKEKSGKTVISNFLADATETSGGEYHPTQGCRILEFEVNGVEVGSRTVNTEVELWDVSGDQKFEACWPAIARDTNGVVFVFNPDQTNHDKELDSWHSYFVEQSNMKESQCVVFAHQRTQQSGRDTPSLGSSMSKILCVNTNVDEAGEQLRDEFNSFLSRLMTSISDKREQEELSIMNSR